MAGFLPIRPSATSYGPAVTDRRPVKDPTRETSANDFNNIRADLVYVAKTAPTMVARIANAGSASVAWYAYATPTVSRSGAGVVVVTMPAGVTVSSASVTAITTSAAMVVVSLTSSTSVTVSTFDGSGAATDMPFHLEVW